MRLQKPFGIAILAFVIVFGLSAGIASAHHSNAEYTNKLTKMEGTVVEYRWRNPHVTVVWDSKDETGKMVRWRGELASITTVVGGGLTKESLKPEQVVKMRVNPSKLGTAESGIR